ncbi:hypothetical protein [Mesorhizobium sp. KR9-304]|uniref:hypothetical protein n=1 Tax=Mesorhizobium sp. KR9-304 TaxID=3156614 RepID=UPI0032B4E856
MEQFGPQVVVGGMPWQAKGEEKTFGHNALTANVLCERHNSSLSPLDAEAGRLFRCLTEGFDHITKKSLSTKTAYFFASGEALERWAIKSLFAFYHGGLAWADGKRLRDGVRFDETLARRAILEELLSAPLGTYVHPNIGTDFSRQVQWAPLLSNGTGALAGVRVQLLGITFDVLVETAEAAFHNKSNAHLHRPTVLDLVGRTRTSRIFLSWYPKIAAEVHRIGILIAPKWFPLSRLQS